jgi:porphobilinogen synthase
MMLKRPRRNRRSPAIRSLVAEHALSPADLVAPFFVTAGENRKEAIATMPGVSTLSADLILKEAEALHRRGIPAIALFPVIDSHLKDALGSEALNSSGHFAEAIRLIKKELPSLCLISDVALDPYTSHGHDGILDQNGDVANDASVEILTKMACLHAACGVDMAAPSDMMDGRVGALRRGLEERGFSQVGILSYTAKYVSSLYGPYRSTLDSAVKVGDKKSYQMNPANVREALLEASLDEEEGADILMVKPALYYLDVIAALRAHTRLPLCAFHVSGEYAMVMAAHEKGIANADALFLEALLSIKRAGADFIISYAAPRILDLI